MAEFAHARYLLVKSDQQLSIFAPEGVAASGCLNQYLAHGAGRDALEVQRGSISHLRVVRKLQPCLVHQCRWRQTAFLLASKYASREAAQFFIDQAELLVEGFPGFCSGVHGASAEHSGKKCDRGDIFCSKAALSPSSGPMCKPSNYALHQSTQPFPRNLVTEEEIHHDDVNHCQSAQ